MHIKKNSILIIIFTCLPLSLYSLPSKTHNEQIGNNFFGVSSSSLMKNQSIEVKTRYQILSNATSIATDGKVNTYNDLIENISKINPKTAKKLPSIEDLTPLNGGSHRFYNHQGYNADYGIDTSKRAKLWEYNRDKILKPSVSASFGLKPNSALVDIVSAELYSIHMFGDLQEGQERSIKQMKGISSDVSRPVGIINDFDSVLDKNYSKLTGKQKVIVKKYQNELSSLRKKYDTSNYNQTNDLQKLKEYSLQAQSEMSKITQSMNKELGIDVDNAVRRQKGKDIFKTTAIRGIASLSIGVGISILSEGLSNGFDDVSIRNVAKNGVIMAVSTTSYSLIEKGAFLISKKLVKTTEDIALKVAFKSTILLDSVFDVGFSFYDWKKGNISGKHAIRKGAFLVASNLGTDALLFVGLPAIFKATELGTLISGPVGGAITFLIATGTYFIINPIIDKYLLKKDSKDIIKEIKNNPIIVETWTAKFLNDPILQLA